MLFRSRKALNPFSQSFHAPFKILPFAISRPEVLHVVQPFRKAIICPQTLFAYAVKAFVVLKPAQ